MVDTVCDNKPCGKSITILGDGSNSFCSSTEGGKYFCCEQCKAAWRNEHPELQVDVPHFKSSRTPPPQIEQVDFPGAEHPGILTFIKQM